MGGADIQEVRGRPAEKEHSELSGSKVDTGMAPVVTQQQNKCGLFYFLSRTVEETGYGLAINTGPWWSPPSKYSAGTTA